jgi:lysophospholipase L1-like esterase
VVRKLAKRYDAVLVDVQAAFDEVLECVHPMSLAWDRVHPDQTGHMVIARAILKALDFVW